MKMKLYRYIDHLIYEMYSTNFIAFTHYIHSPIKVISLLSFNDYKKWFTYFV